MYSEIRLADRAEVAPADAVSLVPGGWSATRKLSLRQQSASGVDRLVISGYAVTRPERRWAIGLRSRSRLVITYQFRSRAGAFRIADNQPGLGKSNANLAQRQRRPQVGSSNNSAVAAFAIGAVEPHGRQGPLLQKAWATLIVSTTGACQQMRASISSIRLLSHHPRLASSRIVAMAASWERPLRYGRSVIRAS